MLGRMAKDGRRALEGEECREGGLRKDSGGMSDVSMIGTEGVRRFLRVLEGSCSPSSLGVGLICVREERLKMVDLLRGFEPPSRLSDRRMLPALVQPGGEGEQPRTGYTESQDVLKGSLEFTSQRDVKTTAALIT